MASGLPCLKEMPLAFHCSVGCCFCCCLAAQLYPTLCDPMDGSPPGSSLHRILQARILEWQYSSIGRGKNTCPPPGDLPNPGIEPVSPVYLALAGGLFTIEPSGKPLRNLLKVKELVPCELVFESEISNSRVRALEKHVPMPACFG